MTGININGTDCIQPVVQFGHTEYHNICSGAVSSVPWGAGDWALVAVNAAALTFAIAVMAALVAAIVFLFRRL